MPEVIFAEWVTGEIDSLLYIVAARWPSCSACWCACPRAAVRRG
jgi:hypothetical protein